jgi:hypothetical protein
MAIAGVTGALKKDIECLKVIEYLLKAKCARHIASLPAYKEIDIFD